jgi:hypothetical protein
LFNAFKDSAMPKHPLAEVFGFRYDDMSPEANHYRQHRLCPFGNKVPNCTKDKAEDPLGTCSVFGGVGNTDVIITCPVRFRQKWKIATDAAEFFFPPGAHWTTVTEVTLPDKYGKSAGNIDLVLVQVEDDMIVDYGAVEVQAVYISGNIRRPFAAYMQDPATNKDMNWYAERGYPRADYLSSSRKRLAPQLMFKGGILHKWKRKVAVTLNTGFFKTLPTLREVPREQAEMAWFVYDLVLPPQGGQYVLTAHTTVYTRFEDSLEQITKAEAGDETVFLKSLSKKMIATQTNSAESTPDVKVLDFSLTDPTRDDEFE